MSVKIRLQRHGKKGKPFYWVVAADARAKRDGKFLEKLGTYNPNTNPATIELNVDAAADWLFKGAQPTDTARALLSHKGALLKHHLNGGVRKGALTQEEADKKFATWLEEKEARVNQKVTGIQDSKAAAKSKALEAEREANARRVAAQQEKLAAQQQAEEKVAEEPVNEEVASEVETTTEETQE